MKYLLSPDDIRSGKSLPSRERGLKSVGQGDLLGSQLSLPSRERGLKFPEGAVPTVDQVVAPLAGAWIEIFSSPILCH